MRVVLQKVMSKNLIKCMMIALKCLNLSIKRILEERCRENDEEEYDKQIWFTYINPQEVSVK